MKRLFAVLSVALAVGTVLPVAGAQASAKPRPTAAVHGSKAVKSIEEWLRTHPTITQPQPPHPGAATTSRIWAGYAAVACKTCQVRYVEATFNVPRVNTCTPSTNGSGAAIWVGLDGVGNKTVEQVGILIICTTNGPAYGGFYEMAPKAAVIFPATFSPGDAIDAKVYFNQNTGGYNLELDNLTTDVPSKHTQTCPGGSVCANASAEVITEAPTVITGSPPGVPTVLDLADFGMVNFDNAVVTDITGKRATLAANGTQWSSTQYTMSNSGTGNTLATPSTLYAGQGFSVTRNNPS